MSAISSVVAGNDILATWGNSVADAINATTATGNTSFTTSETQMAGRTFSANTLAAGTMIKLTAFCTVTSSAANVVTFRVRIGSASLSGTVATSMAPTATNTASNDGVNVEAYVTVRSAGSSGTAIAGVLFVGGAQPFAVTVRADHNTSTITVDTTASRVVELTGQSAAGTTTITVRQSAVELIRP